MKKRFLSAILTAALVTCGAAAQAHLENLQQLPLPEGSFRPVLSPDGATLLFSSQDGTGLKSYDMDNGKTFVIDEGIAAGVFPVFSSDSRTIVYRTAELKDKLMYHDVRKADLYTGKVTVTEKMSRANLTGNLLPKENYALAELDGIVVAKNGEVKKIRPVEDAHSYIEAAMSPDGSRIVFIVPFKGLCVCNADGSDVKEIAARVNNAVWADDNTLLFIVSHDDGYLVLTSALICYHLDDDTFQTLTSEDIMPSEVTAGGDNEVVFSTNDGKIYRSKLVL